MVLLTIGIIFKVSKVPVAFCYVEDDTLAVLLGLYEALTKSKHMDLIKYIQAEL